MIAPSRASLRIGRVERAGAIAAGIVAATAVALLPQWRLVALVEGLGLPALIAAARPPLGWTARGGMMLAAALAGAGGAFMVLRMFVSLGHARNAAARRLLLLRRTGGDGGQPRQTGPDPFAADRALPADLDTPLAAIDPQAIPDVPREPVRAMPSLVRAEPGAREREEAPFALRPVPRPADPEPAPPPRALPDAATAEARPTLSSLLDRLESGAPLRARNGARPDISGLADLRGLARPRRRLERGGRRPGGPMPIRR